jgi:pimeloyl-ACP methyl ester carboxylesterase
MGRRETSGANVAKPFSDIVVVIPGLIGSVLSKDGKALWGTSPGALWRVVAGGALDQLALGGSDNEEDDLGDGISATALIDNIEMIPGLWKQGGYSILADKLVKGMSLVRDENYFEFPYDWRRSNRVSARKLAALVPGWLASWRTKSGNADAKVVFIVHSMGGLVARYYMECLDGWRTTRTLISFGTPYRGSGNALGFLSNGFAWNVGPLKAFDGTKAIRSFDSVYQLLPTYGFVDAGGTGLVRVSELDLPNVDRQRATRAQQFHEEIFAAQERNRSSEGYGPTVRPIVGIEQPTFQSAKLEEGTLSLLTSHEGTDNKGDATVPRVSAIPFEIDQNAAIYIANTHSALQSDDTSDAQLRGILTESGIDLHKYRDAGFAGKIGLRVDDAYTSRAPISVAATPSKYVQKLDGVVHRLDQQVAPMNIVLWPSDGHYKRDLTLPAGLYRIELKHEGFHPVSDVFLVADE